MNKNKQMDQGLEEGERSLRARNTDENKMAVNKESHHLLRGKELKWKSIWI